MMRSVIWIFMAISLSMAACASQAQTGSATTGADAQSRADDASGRTGELSNPDDSTMLYLYYEMAGLSIPIDEWVEKDNRVRSAPGADKAKVRARVRKEIVAGSRAVGNVSRVRLRMNANLSAYDPDYGEFTVRALAPSSSVIFRAHNQRIQLRFSNAQKAQVWKVSPKKSQSVIDRIGDGYSRRTININLLARLQRARPNPQGGVIIARVLQYELRKAHSGTVVTRVKVAP